MSFTVQFKSKISSENNFIIICIYSALEIGVFFFKTQLYSYLTKNVLFIWTSESFVWSCLEVC